MINLKVIGIEAVNEVGESIWTEIWFIGKLIIMELYLVEDISVYKEMRDKSWMMREKR